MRDEVRRSILGGAVWIPLALIVGIVLGGQGLRRDLARTQAELELARSKARPSQERLDPLMQMVAVPPAETPGPESSRAESRAPREVEVRGEDDPSDATELLSAQTESPQSLEERLESVRDLWQVRVDIARDSFVSNAALDRDDTDRFDMIISAMNLRIRDEFKAVAAIIAEKEDFTPEDFTRVAHRITGAMAFTYDEMDRSLTSGWRESAGTELDMFDFIDPAVTEPLLEVESLLDTLSERDSQRWGRP